MIFIIMDNGNSPRMEFPRRGELKSNLEWPNLLYW